MPQKSGDWFSQFEAKPAPVQAAAAPAEGDWFSQFEQPEIQQPTFRQTNVKDVYGQAVVRGEGEDEGGFFTELHNINPFMLNESVQQAFWHPIDTARGLLTANDNLRLQGQQAFQQGDYVTAARHFAEWAAPIMGGVAGGVAGIPGGLPGMAAGAAAGYAGGVGLSSRLGQSGDLMQEGKYARGLGAAVDVGLGIATPAAVGSMLRARPPGVATAAGVPGELSAQIIRPRVPLDPREAAAVAFAQREGIPLDMATATGSTWARQLQKRAGNSMGGETTTQAFQQAQGEALASTAARLADEANPGGVPVNPVTAAENIDAAYIQRIEQQAARQRAEYGRLERFEQAAEEEFVAGKQPKTEPVPAEQVERNFLVRWLADDLREAQFQQGGTTVGGRRIAYEEATAADPSGKHGFVTNAHVAGTPVQRMLDAAGVQGTRSTQAATLENYLSGRTQSKTNARLDAVADVMREAWDGQRFDWELVADETLARTGVSRRDLQAPSTWDPALMSTPGADRFFPSEATPPVAKAPVLEAQKLATDLRPTKEAMRPTYERLQRDHEVAPLMGDRAEALRVLDRFINGPDHVPLSVADTALSQFKRLSRVEGLEALRSEGQGIAAQAVQSLHEQVNARAAAAGPEVLEALEQGRAATRTKYDLAGARETVTGAPDKPADFHQVGVFKGMTAPKDAGISKLRELVRTLPEQVPDVARALLEDIFDEPTSAGGFKFVDAAAAKWRKIGPETKHILYKPEQVTALDNFFALAKKIAENPNPSGSGGNITATNLTVGMIPMWALSKVLYSPRAVAFMNRGLRISVNAAPAAQTAAAAQFAQALRSAGVPLEALTEHDPASSEGRRPQ